MSTYNKHIAECDYCGKTAEMHPINMHVPNTGYALPDDWFRDAYRSDIIMCPNCGMNKNHTVKIHERISEWTETTVYRCKHCKNLFEDKLRQCPWCGANMTNGTTNYR